MKKKSVKTHKNNAGAQDNVNRHEQTEEKLHREEQRFRALIEHSSDIIVVVNLEGIITYINPAVERVLGFKAEERIGANVFELVHPDDMKFKFLADSFNILARDTNAPVIQGEIHLRHKDGSWRTFEAVGSNLVNNNVVEAIIVNYRDITERKSMEEKLRSEEQRFRALAEQSSDIIVFVNREGIVTYENPAVERSLGLKAEERIGVSLFERIHPDDLKFATEAFNAFTLNTSFRDINAPVRQIRIRHKDGSWRTFEAVGSKLVHDNFVEFVIVNLRDITERKWAEKKLINSEEKFRTLAESSPFAILMHQGDYWIYANRAAMEISGYTEEELYSMRFWDFVHPDHKNMGKQIGLDRQQGKAVPREYELKIITKNGAEKWVSLTGNKIQYEDKPTALISVADITERKQAEELLKQSEEKYRLLADHMKDQVWIMNLDLKVTYISPSVEKLQGYTLNEFKQLPLDKILTSASFKAAMDFFSMEMPKALAAPSDYILTRSLEMEFCCKDGHTVWEESKFSFIRDDNGKPLSILVEARDITERKRMEEKLRNDQQELHAIMDASPIGISWSDMQGNIKYTNRKFQEIFGYTVEEIPNIDTWLLLAYPSPAYREHVFSLVSLFIEAQTQGKEANPVELAIVCKNGSIRHVLQTMLFTSNRILVIYYDITERKRAEDVLQQTLDSLKNAVGTTIHVLASAVEARDPYTSGHQSRSADLACAIATEIGLAQDKIEGIRMAGSIHDIGKLSIPAEILSKPTKLTNIEFSLIKEHSRIGYEMLKEVESPWPLAQIVYQHHERVNGSGYPRNLKGNEILMESRILAVADVVEAMASQRPYRPTLGIEAALEEIEKNKGILYDNTAADACLRLFREKGYQLK